MLPAGTYTIVDSNQSTWTYNTLSTGQGHAWVYGSGFSAIAGETGISYTATFNDYIDCICFEVTVKDEAGNVGDPVRVYTDPIIAYWGDLVTRVGQYPFAGGAGSESDPYLIATPEQLAQLAYDIAQDIDYKDKYFIQTDNIDIGRLQWNPIGASATKEFMGYFDGNNKTISNMIIGTTNNPSELEDLGLFGYVSHAVIHNVNIENASIYSSLPDYYGEIGVLAGEVNSSLIHHCSASGTLSSYSYSGSYVGGLIGKIDFYTEGVVACSSSVNITVSSSYSGDVGGLIGEAYGPVIGCSASGNISGSGYIGGLVGNSSDTIIDCYTTGSINSLYMAGGLVGYHDGTILNSYSVGTVYGREYAGGIVGFNNYYSKIKNSFATGNISAGYAGGAAGGLVGSNCGDLLNSYAAGQVTYGQGLLDYQFAGNESLGYPPATTSDCYWNSSLNATGGAGTAKNIEELQSADFLSLLNNEIAAGRDESYRLWEIKSGINNNMPIIEGVGIGMSDLYPVLSSTVGVHNLVAEAEISFMSNVLGQLYYSVVPKGADPPQIDTNGSGILCYAGINEFKISVSSGESDIYIILKDTADILSVPVIIEIAAEPALFAGGSGTEADPYQISTAYHLHNVRYFLDDFFILKENINLAPDLIGDSFWYNPQMGWKAIGSNDLIEATFNGDFNGNGKTISNMTITYSNPSGYDPGYVGLFGYVNISASIRNLGVEAFNISSSYSGGGAGGLAASLYGMVDHCYATGSISVGGISAGGLVGSNYTATITNSWADVDIQSTGWSYVGGLTGYNNGYIRNCAATGDIEAGSGSRAGGLTGNNYSYTSEADIQNCYAAGNISGSGWGFVGPFYGENNEGYSVAAFEDCFWNEDAVITAIDEGGATPSVHASSQECQAVGSSYMKSQAFVDVLNDGLPDTTGYYEWVVLSDINGGYPVLKTDLSSDFAKPVVSDSIITDSEITSSSVVLSWNKASDVVTAEQDLLYAIYQSTSDNIYSVSEIETNGTPVTDFASSNTYAVTGLTPLTKYYFNIIVKDEAGNKEAYQTKSITTLTAGNSGGTIDINYYINASSGKGGTISPSGKINILKNQSKTFSMTPEPGYVIGEVLVDGVSVGAIEEYTFSGITRNHIIEVVFESRNRSFTDVDRNQWYSEGVDFMISKRLFNGTSETTFEPNTNMTRAMLVTVLWRLENEPDATIVPLFADITTGTWYAEAVAWAAQNGIVEGYDADMFGPQDPITREQMAAILFRYASYKGYDITAKDDLSEFNDVGNMSVWATGTMKWAVAEELIKGVSRIELDPAGYATRAQVASILMRFVQNIVE